MAQDGLRFAGVRSLAEGEAAAAAAQTAAAAVPLPAPPEDRRLP